MPRETGLYYLQSRYYNPEWGRFINADNQIDAENPLGLNLFAYCGNNPVNRVDPTGEAWWHWAIGAAVVVGFGVLTVATCGWSLSAAALSVGLVANGIAATTAASTVAAAAFIGSATVYGAAAISAAVNATSVQDFYDQGNWGTVAATVSGGLWNGYCGYNMYNAQEAQWNNAYNFNGRKNEKYASNRGWHDEQIRHAIHNGQRGISINQVNQNTCTAYKYPGFDNQYVVIDNSTRSIVQVSNLYDQNWVVDRNIVWWP